MVTLSDVIQFMYPAARQLTDFTVSDNGAGPVISFWNTAVLGTQPTPQEIATATPLAQAAADAAAQAAIDAAAERAAIKASIESINADIEEAEADRVEAIADIAEAETDRIAALAAVSADISTNALLRAAFVAAAQREANACQREKKAAARERRAGAREKRDLRTSKQFVREL